MLLRLLQHNAENHEILLMILISKNESKYAEGIDTFKTEYISNLTVSYLEQLTDVYH